MAKTLSKQRARNDGDKQLRRDAILEAATRLVGEVGYGGLTMVDVARAAGVAKGTLYLYFATKEALVLAVFERQLALLFDDVAGELARSGCDGPEAFARVMADALARHRVFVDLSTVLHTVLEHNVDLDTAIRFKRALRDQLVRGGAIVEALFPFLRPGDGAHLFLRLHALMIGVRQLSDPSPVVARAHREPDLAVFRVDFAAELADLLVCVLRGMEASRSARRG